jgi:hypothetical protein
MHAHAVWPAALNHAHRRRPHWAAARAPHHRHQQARRALLQVRACARVCVCMRVVVSGGGCGCDGQHTPRSETNAHACPVSCAALLAAGPCPRSTCTRQSCVISCRCVWGWLCARHVGSVCMVSHNPPASGAPLLRPPTHPRTHPPTHTLTHQPPTHPHARAVWQQRGGCVLQDARRGRSAHLPV